EDTYRLARHWREKHPNERRDALASSSSTETLGCGEGIDTAGTKKLFTSLNITEPTMLLSYRCAAANKPYSDVSLWNKINAELLDMLEEPSAADKLRNLAVSRFTVARNIDKLGDKLEEELLKKLMECSVLSLCLDESTDLTDTAQLLIFQDEVELLEDEFESMANDDDLEEVEYLDDEFQLSFDEELENVNMDDEFQIGEEAANQIDWLWTDHEVEPTNNDDEQEEMVHAFIDTEEQEEMKAKE
uniref:DUF4371 domain-containing protein n=1 Tax=Phlebotomus papatasi TaxID=29031 RepID=A0A1B0DFR2_PHLPP